MQMLKIVLLAFLLTTSGCQRCAIKKDSADVAKPWDAALSYAQAHLPKSGQLVQQKDGYAYLKVDDRYIHELFPLLENKTGFEKPPFFRRPDSLGAHVSVFYEDENVVAKEAGQTFSFTLKDIVMVHPNKKTSFIVLQVHSKALEELRKKYGLRPKLKDHEFHISIAKKTHH